MSELLIAPPAADRRAVERDTLRSRSNDPSVSSWAGTVKCCQDPEQVAEAKVDHAGRPGRLRSRRGLSGIVRCVHWVISCLLIVREWVSKGGLPRARRFGSGTASEDGNDEDLSVADAARWRRPRLIACTTSSARRASHDDFELELGDEIDDVGRAAMDTRACLRCDRSRGPSLTVMPPTPELGETLLDVVEGERAHDRFHLDDLDDHVDGSCRRGSVHDGGRLRMGRRRLGLPGRLGGGALDAADDLFDRRWRCRELGHQGRRARRGPAVRPIGGRRSCRCRPESQRRARHQELEGVLPRDRMPPMPLIRQIAGFSCRGHLVDHPQGDRLDRGTRQAAVARGRDPSACDLRTSMRHRP